MKSRHGEILYVGKAKNLRNRLRSYFQRPSKLQPKVFALMKQVTAIDTETVGSELEALLLEARLIKEHQPFYNRMVKHYQHMLFLKVTVEEKAPCLRVSLDMDDPKAVYYGPFSSRGDLEFKIESINRVFRLRSCSDQQFAQHALNPCTQYQIGLCAGPCGGDELANEHRASVRDFLCYMGGEPCHTVDLLTAKREAYAEALLFEKAAGLQAELEALEALQLQHYERLQTIEAHHCIIILPAMQANAVRLLAVLHGLPHEWRTFPMDDPDWGQLSQWLGIWLAQKEKAVTSIPKELYEEARLISRWLNREQALVEGWTVYFEEKSVERLVDELQCVLLAGELPEPGLDISPDPNRDDSFSGICD
jgi:excinuclease ABC subunit C